VLAAALPAARWAASLARRRAGRTPQPEDRGRLVDRSCHRAGCSVARRALPARPLLVARERAMRAIEGAVAEPERDGFSEVAARGAGGRRAMAYPAPCRLGLRRSAEGASPARHCAIV